MPRCATSSGLTSSRVASGSPNAACSRYRSPSTTPTMTSSSTLSRTSRRPAPRFSSAPPNSGVWRQSSCQLDIFEIFEPAHRCGTGKPSSPQAIQIEFYSLADQLLRFSDGRNCSDTARQIRYVRRAIIFGFFDDYRISHLFRTASDQPAEECCRGFRERGRHLSESWSTVGAGQGSGGLHRRRGMQPFWRGPGKLSPTVDPNDITRRDLLALAALGLVVGAPGSAVAAAPDGQLTWGVHVSLAPVWFDPADVSGIITPFMVLYALHDAMVKLMPGQSPAPSLAEAWSASEDGLAYDFTLRQGTLFHNGDPVTAADVKFSFERYRGTSHDLMMERVAAVEIPDPRHIRFKLKRPWPDFLTFYASATAAGWIVPKKYIEKAGDDGFKKAPIGAGPYKFVSFNPGVELVLEAFDQYWRKPPKVKRLVFKVIPDESTRLAALKRGEIDIVYSIRGELAEELQRTPGLTLKPAVVQGVFCLYFPDQCDPKSR